MKNILLIVIMIFCSCKVPNIYTRNDCWNTLVEEAKLDYSYFDKFLEGSEINADTFSNDAIIVLYSLFAFEAAETESYAEVVVIESNIEVNMYSLSYNGALISKRNLKNNDDLITAIDSLSKIENRFVRRECEVLGGIKEAVLIKRNNSNELLGYISSVDFEKSGGNDSDSLFSINWLVSYLINIGPKL